MSPDGVEAGVQTAVDGVIATITIRRPERRNALDLTAVEALDDAVTAVRAAGARCVLLTGSDGHFCAGADLKELEDLTFTHRLREMLDHLNEIAVPTIAVIEGSCM
ncbi:MAG TPA: enoyl-CoA hydratase/isomerase family protein, partial [Microthrixaceae bacterium]|nr:enoyl-CoA hydratase/isomerase family protein [Microthrixaceae bacterium]